VKSVNDATQNQTRIENIRNLCNPSSVIDNVNNPRLDEKIEVPSVMNKVGSDIAAANRGIKKTLDKKPRKGIFEASAKTIGITQKNAR